MASETGQRTVERYRQLVGLTQALAAPVEVDQMLTRIADAARELLDADRATVFVHDAERGELCARVAHGQPDLRFPADRGIAGEAAQTRRIVNIPDCYADARFNREIDAKTGYRTQTLLSAPMISSDEQLVGVLQVLNKRDGAFTELDEELGQALAAQCAVLLQRALLMQDRLARQQLEHDLDIARRIQRAALPDEWPRIPHYDLAAWCDTADQTGGDMYDVITDASGRVWLALADASGHGIGPALSVSQMRAMLRTGVRLETPLDVMMRQINEQLLNDLPIGQFITAFVATLDPTSHRLRYIAAGQGPLLHYEAKTGACQHLNVTTCPLAIDRDLFDASVREVALDAGDCLALLTDGIYEARNARDEELGTEPVAALLRDGAACSADTLVQQIKAAVADFQGELEQFDDMTGLLLRRPAHGSD